MKINTALLILLCVLLLAANRLGMTPIFKGSIIITSIALIVSGVVTLVKKGKKDD